MNDQLTALDILERFDENKDRIAALDDEASLALIERLVTYVYEETARLESALPSELSANVKRFADSISDALLLELWSEGVRLPSTHLNAVRCFHVACVPRVLEMHKSMPRFLKAQQDASRFERKYRGDLR